MSVALDFGTDSLKSAWNDNGRLKARTAPAVYAALPDSRARRKLLEQLKIPYAACEDNLVMMGQAAREYSRMFQTPCIPLLAGGRIPEDDPPARQIIAALVQALLPTPDTGGEVCTITLPGEPLTRQEEQEAEFLKRLVRLQGYTPQVLTAGMAVVLAELVGESFTGLGISLGASFTEVSVAHHGVEALRCSIPRGGNWIDEQLAVENDYYAWDARGNQYLDSSRSGEWKEQWDGTLQQPASKEGKLLARLYGELLDHVLSRAAAAIAKSPRVAEIPGKLAVAITGGPVSIGGFDEFFASCVAQHELPVDTDRIRPAARSAFTVSRGLLIQAELESSVRTATLSRAA